jgi:uncharacterized protein YggL (DUF469 family)
MPQEKRFARPRVGFDDPLRSTEKSVVVPRQTPTFGSERAGLEQLGDIFNGFFSQVVRAGQIMQSAEHAENLARIEQENKVQQSQAFKKAMAGETLTEEEKRDRDYTQVYDKTLGQKYGLELAQKFALEVNKLPVSENVDAFMETFLKEQLQNGYNYGTGNDLFDASLLSTFKQKTDSLRQLHKEASVKSQLEKGRQDLQAVIAGRLTELEPADIPTYIEEMKTLRPLDPNGAPADVMSALIAAAGTDPNKARHVLWLLHQPGSGDKGKSFAKMFPDAALDIEQKLTKQYQSGVTWAGSQEYDYLRGAIENTDDPGLLAAIAMPGGALDKVRERYGKGGQFESLRSAALTKLEKAGQQVVALNSMKAMMNDLMPLDVSLVRKHMQPFLDSLGIKPFEQPEATARVITGLKFTMSDDLRQEYSAALSNLNNPARFAQSMRFYKTIEQTGGEEAALDLMDQSVRQTYLYAKRHLQYEMRPLEEILLHLNENRSGLEVAAKTTWGQIIGTPGKTTDAEQSVRKQIISELEDTFGSTVQVSESEMANLMALSKDTHMARNRTGGGDWKESIKDTVRSVSRGLQVVPGENGKLMVESVLIPPAIPKTDNTGRPILDERGSPIREPIVPFGRKVFNPQTGRPEDTVKTFRDDAAVLTKALSGTTLGGKSINDADDISLDGRSAWAPKGVWLVKHQGEHIAIGLGQKLKINGQEIEVPADPAQAREMATGLAFTPPAPTTPAQRKVSENFSFPAKESFGRAVRPPVSNGADTRFVLIPYPADGSMGFLLGYRPGFRERLPTIEEREQSFKGK